MTAISKQIKRHGDIQLRRDLERLDEPIRADKWRNFFFLKTGKCFHGTVNYQSEHDAMNAATEWEKSLTDKDGFIDSPWNVPVSAYSHAIQLPIKE